MARGRIRSFAVAAVSASVLAPCLLVAGELPAPAQAPPPAAQGSFTCRSSAVAVLGVEAVVANPGTAPCADDSRSLLNPPVPSLALQAVSARTQASAGGGPATSMSRAAGVDLALLGLRADVIESRATVACEAGQPQLSGSSTVVGLVVNGQPVPVGAPAELALPAGTLRVNHTATVGNALVQRAVWLETALGSIVLGEAEVGFSGSPCTGAGTITVVQISDPDSTQNFSFTGDLGPFLLRDDGTSAGADRRIFLVRVGQYRITELQPTGGRIPRAWEPREVQCTDADTVVDLAGRTVVVNLQVGENVVCTFRNFNQILTDLAASAGIEDPGAGLDPVVFKRDQPTPPSTAPRGGIEPPLPPTTTVTIPPDRETGGSVLAGTGLVAVPLLALLGGILWFVLAAARRRREDETA